MERRDPKKDLVVLNVMLCITSAAFCGVWFFLPKNQWGVALGFLFFSKELLQRAFNTSLQKAFATLVPVNQRDRASTAQGLLSQGGAAIGRSLGEAGARALGALVFVADACTFLFSGVIILCLPIPGSLPHERDHGSPRLWSRLGRIWGNIREAADHVRRSQAMWAPAALFGGMMVCWQAWDLYLPFLLGSFDQTGYVSGALLAAQIAEVTTGLFLLRGITYRQSHVASGALLLVFATALCAVVPRFPWLVVPLGAIKGFSSYVGGNASRALLINRQPDEFHGRLASLHEAGYGLIAALAKIALGVVSDRFGAPFAFLGVALVLGGIEAAVARLRWGAIGR